MRYGGYEVGLPLNRAAFETALAKAMEIEYEKDAEGHYLLDADGERIPASKGGMSVSMDGESMMDFTLWAMTPAQAEKLQRTPPALPPVKRSRASCARRPRPISPDRRARRRSRGSCRARSAST